MAGKKRATAADPVRQRIRAAEKAAAPVTRALIGMDAESYETVALLVERGLGTGASILREALAVGLRGMKASSEPKADVLPMPFLTGLSSVPPVYPRFEPPLATMQSQSGLMAAVGGDGIPFGHPIAKPPSVERREQEAEEYAVDADG